MSLHDLGSAPTLPAGFQRLGAALATLDAPVDKAISAAANGSANGGALHRVPRLTRLEVEIAVEGLEPMVWLAHQQVMPRVYFSNQDKSLRAAGVGAAERIDGSAEEALRSLAGGSSSRTRFYGGGRFDPEADVRDEWAGFGRSVFVLPLFELQVCDGGRCFLACHLRWAHDGSGPLTWERAARGALLLLQQLHVSAEVVSPPQQPLPTLVSHEGSLSPDDWEEAIGRVLHGIESGAMSKVVLAQRVRLQFDAAIEPLHVLLRLLEVNDAAIAEEARQPNGSHRAGGNRHAYLFLLQLDTNLAFMGCSPEKLFKLEGDQLTTEALAGTRPRGETAEADAALAHELLHCAKDLDEVTAVRDFLVRVLGPASERLHHSEPFVLQLRHVQHICVPFSAKLVNTSPPQPGASVLPFVRSALSLLHPTPAVCGTPSDAARRTIRELERFDRGFYAGPLGYVAADGCEFCVAIRSALLRGREASIFAGAGIVRGSAAVSEWEEVHVKMKNFVALFPCAGHLLPPAAPSPFLQLPNLNAVCASLVVEELLRGGLAHVVLCPGSRCAPLTVAVARSGCPHTLANDERGAGFLALGYARASGRCAAVVVSSGTAVANLLPAVVEAAHDHVPLLLLTADRPPEARDTAANQTISQVGLLAGGPLRWFKDLPCPTADVALEPLLSDASYALARACGEPCGPVHLNFMLREPLAPTPQPWPHELLTRPGRLSRWLHSRAPFCNYLRPYGGLGGQVPDAQLLPVVALLRGARRGLIVVGATFTATQRRAVAALADRLDWPMLPDVCSGMRSHESRARARLVPLFDVVLSDATLSAALAVDVVVQVGGRLVSKRLQALVASASTALVQVDAHGERMDPDHCVTHRLHGDVACVLDALRGGLGSELLPRNPLLALCEASLAAEAALQQALADSDPAAPISEPWVARRLCAALADADDELLFASNSLPIRHIDSYCAATPLVLSNRGASGIDGILHTAIGVALGSGSRCTLLVGDLATLHDLNALDTLGKTHAPLTVVVLNNHGGGIFRFLPIAGHDDVYSPYFDTPHAHDFAAFCRGFGIPHAHARTRSAFEAALADVRRAAGGAGPCVVEVATDKEEGHALIGALRKAASHAALQSLAEKVS